MPVRYAAAVSPAIDELLAETPLRDLVTSEGPYPFFADRERALFSAWYEFFPRSEGAYVDETTGKTVPGTCARPPGGSTRSPRWASTSSTCPRSTRSAGEPQGPQQHSDARPGGPGLAVGDRLGRGRPRRDPPRARHVRGLRRVRRPRHELGLEVALDLALQAAPDHPWVNEHPEWFTTRADGSIAYAENPPKKYQDIYPELLRFPLARTCWCRSAPRTGILT